MAARLILDAILVLLAVVAVLVGVYRFTARQAGAPAPRHEIDVAAEPSEWFTDSRAIEGGTRTEVCIVRVARRTQEILERRVLRVLDSTVPGYAQQLDQAMDEAYQAMRVANVNLNRR